MLIQRHINAALLKQQCKNYTPAQKCLLSLSLINAAVYFLENIFWEKPFTHKVTLKEGKAEKK